MLLKRASALALLFLLAPCNASAVQYEIFVDVENEEDLYDLLLTEQVSESSFNALLLLHQTRIDLNRASREQLYLLPNLDYGHVDLILAFRKAARAIHNLEELVGAGVLSMRLSESLRAFVIIGSPEAPRPQTHGFVRVQSRWSGRYDRLPPAAAVQARIQALRSLDIGVVAALTRNDLHRVRWDPTRDAFTADAERVRVQMPKLYVEWDDDRWEIVAGTYRIGFGQRLTFDVTDQVTPNGSFGDYELRRGNELELGCRRARGELSATPCRQDLVARVTPDYEWTNRLAGVALGLKHLSAGPGWLQLYVWGSYQVHRIQQIEIADAGECDDPRQDDEAECDAPPVYVRGSSLTAPASTATYATLPAMYAEGLAGGNVSYFWNARSHLGITGYGSFPRWLVEGVELGFQEIARKPFGGAFGAIGLNAAIGFGRQDLFVELARSFDSERGGGGGYGAVFRSVTTLRMTELEASGRYYGSSYVNPYARPLSAPDELDGLRARDEAGLRLRAATQLGRRVGLRTLADAWRRLSSGKFNGLVFARMDLQVAPAWAYSIWSEYRSSAGQRLLLATQLMYQPVQRLAVSAQFLHRWVGPKLGGGQLQQDIAAVVSITTRPIDFLRIRIRARYDFEDIWNNHRLPQVLWTYVDTTFTVREHDVVRLRYDFRIFLDRREATLSRVPNPEHWLWIEYAVRY
ncbi:MAG: hypothetical protein WCE62_04835 [Polyangiales bacterium]